MKLPSFLSLSKVVASAVANRSKWESMAAEPVVGNDPDTGICVSFNGKTNRFDSATAADPAMQAVADAVLRAVNDALTRSDARWQETVAAVPGGAEVLSSGDASQT